MLVIPASALPLPQPPGHPPPAPLPPFGGIPPEVVVAMQIAGWWSQVTAVEFVGDPGEDGEFVRRSIPLSAARMSIAAFDRLTEYVKVKPAHNPGANPTGAAT